MAVPLLAKHHEEGLLATRGNARVVLRISPRAKSSTAPLHTKGLSAASRAASNTVKPPPAATSKLTIRTAHEIDAEWMPHFLLLGSRWVRSPKAVLSHCPGDLLLLLHTRSHVRLGVTAKAFSLWVGTVVPCPDLLASRPVVLSRTCEGMHDREPQNFTAID